MASLVVISVFVSEYVGSAGLKVARVRKWRTPGGGRRPGVQPTPGPGGRRARCAPPPDPLGWACGGSRRSPLLARRRTARNSLNGSRPSRAAWLLSHRELSHRAYRFGRTLRWPRRGCWVCVLVRLVSCQLVSGCGKVCFCADCCVSLSFVLVAIRTTHGTLDLLF